ncbi:hypothetical protein [Thioalbus denitrificans]|jgi:hypothetical protein|uniref:Uncharacterized protein n=1 Tax=Thioalbus denitrificans TaxID=547122 RepID=A0A369BQT7_9GAMM|nr:hypothetical protein [Thioalbus denitrificans]RCX21964.1 hypothetical protein DFQ59_1205 [Thioalbus denitrificans]
MPEEKATKVYKLRVRIPKGMTVEMVLEPVDAVGEGEAETEQGRIKWGDDHLSCCVDGAVVSPVSTINAQPDRPGGDRR